MRYAAVRARCDVLRRRAGQNPYIRVFVLLLLTVVAMLSLLMGIWCDDGHCSCQDTQEASDSAANPVLEANLVSMTGPGGRFRPGQRAADSITGRWDGTNPGTMTLTYTPREGAGWIQFDGRQPDEQRPDGSYVWHNVPVHYEDLQWNSDTVVIWYNVPLLPEGQSEMRTASTLTVTHPNGQQATSQSVGTVAASPPRSGDALPASMLPPDAAPKPAAQAEDYYLWRVGTWSSIFGMGVTTDVCQQWVGLLQQGKVFVGLRFPLLNATPPYTDSYKLPVAFTGQYSPTLELIDYSSGPPTSVLTIPMTYKPAHHTFLSNALPWEDDERWFALGADDSQPITCPEGLNLDPGDWEVVARLWLDFGGAEGDCANCVLRVYYCYQGEEWPAVTGAAAPLLKLAAASYQGWGITCIGPHLLRLGNEMTVPKFGIYETANRTVSPTEPITLHHRIVNHGTETVTLTLGITSTLGAGWTVYTEHEQPLPQPIVLPKDTGYSFHVCGTVPADARGPHTVYVTATSAAPPNPSAQATDLLWVGEWESPPPPTTWHRIRLPVTMIQ